MSNAVIFAPRAYAGDAFAGVRRRRVFAWMLDVIIVAALTALVWTALMIATFGLSFLVLPPLFPIVAVIYYALTVSGEGRGSYGMRALDLEAALVDSGARAPFIEAAAQALLFYLSWLLPILFVITLVDSEKRYLHDILSGVVIFRRGR